LEKELPIGSAKIIDVSPNPSQGEMRILFSLPGWKKKYPVSVSLINTLGQKVTDIYSDILLSGSHDVAWSGFARNGERPASGVYFLKLVCSGSTSIYRIVLD
jgi:hypothetical protein